MTIAWHCSEFSQVLILTDEVIQYVSAHRQLSASAFEAGGQLFGNILDPEVVVSVATGPYSGDKRSRFSYRSNPQSAANCIQSKESKGLAYLGEWHTHAEPHPTPSREDVETMTGIVQKSTLKAQAAMLLIVGTSPVPKGMYLGTFQKGKFNRWTPDGHGGKCSRMIRRFLDRFS